MPTPPLEQKKKSLHSEEPKSVKVPRTVAQNLKQLIHEQEKIEKRQGVQIRVAHKVVRFSGTMAFFWGHMIVFVAWILFNGGFLTGAKPFDPYPFEFLTFVVSLDAIVLSIFVLIAQNQIQETADRRAELDLHVNLLAEREATLILRKLVRIEKALNIEVDTEESEHISELLTDTDPVDIFKTIQQVAQRHHRR